MIRASNQAEARRFSAKPLMLEAPHFMAARGASVPVRCRGEMETCEKPVLPPQRCGSVDRGSSATESVRHPGKVNAPVRRAAPEPGNQPWGRLVGSRWAIGETAMPAVQRLRGSANPLRNCRAIGTTRRRGRRPDARRKDFRTYDDSPTRPG
jgi:hypothetical protein